MIDFRYHVVSLVAVFLALAVGIVLGAGPLQEGLGTQLSNQVAQLRTEKADLNTRLTDETRGRDHGDEVAAAAAPALADTLAGQSVTLVVLPSADTQLVADASSTIKAAGGTIAGETDVDESWFDPARADARTKVADELAPKLGLPAGATSSGDVATILARGLAFASASRAAETRTEADPADVRRVLTDAGLMSVIPQTPERGHLVVVVGGPYAGESDVVDARSVAIRQVVVALQGRSDGVLVIEGDPTPPGTGRASSDVISAVRADTAASRTVSSLDNAQHGAGRTELVLALVALGQGVRGHYGPVAGAVPPALPTPTAKPIP